MTSGNANTATSAGSGPRLLVETQFTYDDQTNFFLIQGDNRSGWNQASNAFLQLGFRTPPDNTSRGGAIGNNDFGSNDTDYLGIVNGAGSVYNFVGYLPTYNDLATGAPVENVRVRVATSALKTGAATLTTTTGNWHSQLTADGQEKTLGTNFYANEYLTDSTGQLVTSRYTLNGWNAGLVGYYDPFKFQGQGVVADSNLATLDLDTVVLEAPEHCAPVLLQHLKGTASGTSSATNAGFTRHQARYQARSYTHNISEDFTESSTTLPDGSARAVNADYAIDRTVRNELTRPVEINATEVLALASFDTASARQAQGVYEYILANWSSYITDIEPTVSGDTFTWNGGLTLTDANSAPAFTTNGTALSLPRVSSMVAGSNINAISAGNITINTDITGVDLTSSGVMTLASSATISGSTLTAALGFSNFPTTLDGSITFVGEFRFFSSANLNVTDNSNLGGLILNVDAGETVNVTGAVESDFADVTGAGTVNYLFGTTITADVSDGLITIRKADGTYIHRPNVNSITLSSADLPAGTHRAIVTAKGRSAVPVEIVVDGATDFALMSSDLTPLGYSTTTNIGTSRTYAKATFDSRQVVRTTETGKNNYYIDPLESARWFGDLYGEESTNEVILDNFALTEDTEMFSLNAGSNVTAVNLPLVQAYHGTGVTGVLTFSANITEAKDVDSDYVMTDAVSTTVNAPADQGVNSVPNSVGGLNSVIVGEVGRAVEEINNNTDAELEQVTNDVRAMRDNKLLGLKPQAARTP